MNRRHLTWIYVAVISAAALLVSSRASFSQANAGRLAGSWSGTVTATNPPGLPPFNDLITFTSDGSVIESRRPLIPASASPFGPVLETTGHGTWQRVGEGEFDIYFVFLLQANDGSGAELGTDNVHVRARLDSTGANLSGTFASVVKTPNGDIPFEGTYQATPILSPVGQQ